MTRRGWARIAMPATAACVLVLAPIAAAMRDLRMDPAAEYSRVHPAESIGEGRDGSAARLQRYLSRRNGALDHHLPAGEGGTSFVEHLGGKGGIAIPGRAAIVLVVPPDDDGAESTELHERAHLLQAFMPGAVAKVLAAAAAPAAGQYAATGPGEHFAEMASSAWHVIVPPHGISYVDSPLERLADAERDVPGTAGFVVWFLRDSAMLSIEGSERLLAEAERVSAPSRTAWEIVWRNLDHRRQDDGTYEPWKAMTVGGYLAWQRSVELQSRTWRGRFIATAFLPALALARLWERAGT